MNVHVRRWVIFALFGLAYLTVFLQRMGMAIINPDVAASLSLTPTQMGTLGSVAFYAYAASILFSGFLATTLGPRKTITIFFGLAGVGALLFSTTSVFILLLLGVGLLGCGTSVVVTSATVAFSRWFTMKEFARLMAFYFFLGGIGNFVGTAPLSWMAQAFGWRATFTAISFLILGIAAVAFLLVRDFPPEGAIARDNEPAKPAGPKLSMWQYLGQAVRNKNFWCIFIWYGSLNSVFYVFGAIWAGMYFSDVYGLTRTQYGGILMMGACGLTFGGPILTYLSEKIFKSYRMGITLSNILCASGIGMIALNIDSLSVPMLYLAVFLIGMAPAPSALFYAATRAIFGPHMAGGLAGVWSFVLFGSGGILSMIIGSVVHSGKDAGVPNAVAYGDAFYIFLACAAVGIIAGIILKDAYVAPDPAPAAGAAAGPINKEASPAAAK